MSHAIDSTRCVPPWQKTARRKKAVRDEAIPLEWRLQPDQVTEKDLNVMKVPLECGILTTREIKITGLDARVLVERLISRRYSSYEVTLAFCKRAAIAQQLVNCLTEVFFTEALRTAEAIDAEYAVTGQPRGILHGLPVSLKDCFRVAGSDTTIGYTAYVGQETLESEESEITKIMRESGAVLFCKTNVPLALMSGETYNAIYGYTSNPYNRSLSSGGSSGGESALLALRGSPLGVGTDVGGSIRIPASFCGLYSLKPSFGRFPTYGVRDGLEGLEAVRSTVGPMARSLDGIEMWSKAVLKSEPWMKADPCCLPIPWRTVSIPKKLCFGLLLDDGIVKPPPPVKRALLQMRRSLEAAGHTVFEFTIDDPQYPETLKLCLYRSAAADLIDCTLAQTGQPWPKGYEMLEGMVSKPGHDQSHTSDGVDRRKNEPATVLELWKAQTMRAEYAKHMLEAWAATANETGTGREMDALLLPGPWPASSKHGFIYDNCTSLWNVLDYCATTLPVTTVSHVERMEPGFVARSNVEARVWQEYSPQRMIGCSISVQIVGRRLNEEYLLGVTRVCDDALRRTSEAAQ